MAFQMKPGRSPFKKTGHGIPSPFLQENLSTGEDLRKKAKEAAEAKLKQKMESAGPNMGGAGVVRNFEASATATAPGKPVERFAKTAEEIAKWKAAPEANKAKYKSQSVTETVKASDRGTSLSTSLTAAGIKSNKPVISASLPTGEEIGRHRVTKEETRKAMDMISYNNYVKNPNKGFQKPGMNFETWRNAEKNRMQKNAENNPEPKGSNLVFAKSSAGNPCKTCH
jgi:hypothetical protein